MAELRNHHQVITFAEILAIDLGEHIGLQEINNGIMRALNAAAQHRKDQTLTTKMLVNIAWNQLVAELDERVVSENEALCDALDAAIEAARTPSSGDAGRVGVFLSAEIRVVLGHTLDAHVIPARAAAHLGIDKTSWNTFATLAGRDRRALQEALETAMLLETAAGN